ncbi:MAG: MarR family transcriptional regulator [Alphaproteobacteria bacterium]|nr:MarR family transcriptional regulator [Alphaproteobacteria bacterium]
MATRAWLRLMACHNLIETRLRRKLRARFGLSLAWFDILAQIDRPPAEPTLGELSERVLATKANITELVGKIAAAGLIARRKSARDARVVHVRLTAKGKRALSAMLAAHRAWLAEAMAALAPAELAALDHALSRLRAGLKSPSPGSAP